MHIILNNKICKLKFKSKSTKFYLKPKLNIFEIEANSTNGMTLKLVQYVDINGKIESLSLTDWGDGTVDKLSSHTYKNIGTYIVKTKLQPSNKHTEYDNYNTLIKAILNIRNDINNLSYFCYNCSNLKNFSCKNYISNITDMSYMFCQCSSLTSLDVSNFNTDNCEDFGYMFSGLSVPSLNLTSFKVDSDDNTNHMFTNTSSNCSIYIDSTKFNKTEADCAFAGTFINGPYPAN